jgi:heme exporter protein C
MKIFLTSFGLLLILISGSLALTIAAVEPIERNIVYVHVPAAICSLVCFGVLFFCSIQYLRKKQQKWDFASAACGEVGLFFATLMNLTGMVFARIEWGLWWTPSPRLVSSAALWFLYAAYLILRTSFNDGQKKEKVSAVFGIIAFADVPLVIISARFIRDIHRPGFAFDKPIQSLTLFIAALGAVLLMTALIWLRTGISERKNQIDLKP